MAGSKAFTKGERPRRKISEKRQSSGDSDCHSAVLRSDSVEESDNGEVESDASTRTSSSEDLKWTKGQVRAARHKICFVVTFADGLVTAFWLGRQPQTFWLNYSIKMVFLLSARFLCWRPLRQHYYMFDFCYFANCVTLSYVFICPQSPFLFNA